MRGMNSESVDLIYLDPPFNSNRTYSAPIGSEAAGAAFKDSWTLDDVDIAWIGLIAEKEPCLPHVIDAAGISHGTGMKAYMVMIAVRLLEMRRLLKPTGSIYLHCDPTASHYLKAVMDCVFGSANFRNEVVWGYKKMPNRIKAFQRNHDTILFYAMSSDSVFNVLRTDPDKGSLKTYESSYRTGYNFNASKGMVTVFDWDKYRAAVAQGKLPSDLTPTEFTGGRPPMRSWWTDIKILGGPKNKERVGYPTQKPLALLNRIIEASSNEGDVVLDPFCGCATACVAAHALGRLWTGIDISSKAAELMVHRLRQDRMGQQADLTTQAAKVIHRTDIPKRTDVGELPPYKTHKHTLYGKQEGRCAGCQHHFPFQNFTVDHIVPRSKGGTDHLENLQLLCNHCNSVKGTMDQAAFAAKLLREGIGQ